MVDYLEYIIVQVSIKFQDLDFDSKYIWTMDPKASLPGSGDPSPIVRRTIIIVSCGPPIVMAHSPSTSYWSFVLFEDQFWFCLKPPRKVTKRDTKMARNSGVLARQLLGNRNKLCAALLNHHHRLPSNSFQTLASISTTPSSSHTTPSNSKPFSKSVHHFSNPHFLQHRPLSSPSGTPISVSVFCFWCFHCFLFTKFSFFGFCNSSLTWVDYWISGPSKIVPIRSENEYDSAVNIVQGIFTWVFSVVA